MQIRLTEGEIWMIKAEQARETATNIAIAGVYGSRSLASIYREEELKENCIGYVENIIMPKIRVVMNHGGFALFIGYMDKKHIEILEQYGYRVDIVNDGTNDFLKISWVE